MATIAKAVVVVSQMDLASLLCYWGRTTEMVGHCLMLEEQFAVAATGALSC